MFQRRGTDVPVVLDLMIPDIDLILDFVRGDVSDIRASGGESSPPASTLPTRAGLRQRAIANVTSSRAFKQERKIRFFQRDAYFSRFQHQARYLVKMRDIMKYLPQTDEIPTSPKIWWMQNIDLTDSQRRGPRVGIVCGCKTTTLPGGWKADSER